MRVIVCYDHTLFGLPPGKSADEVPPSERLFEVGMTIGNLTSQLLANVCLNELDQYIKHELRAHYYIQHMGLELQNRMDTKLDVPRTLVDTAVSPEDRLISPGLHEVWSKELNEIGRMLGGWKKSNV